MNYVKDALTAELLHALKGKTQIQAAALLGATQANMSNLRRGKLDNYSADRLIRWLGCLGYDVKIQVVKRGRGGKTPAHKEL